MPGLELLLPELPPPVLEGAGRFALQVRAVLLQGQQPERDEYLLHVPQPDDEPAQLDGPVHRLHGIRRHTMKSMKRIIAVLALVLLSTGMAYAYLDDGN